MSIDAVLFDLDDTLCEYRRGGDELLSLAYDQVGIDPIFSVEEYHAVYAEFADDSEGIRDLRERCFARLASERGHDPDLGRSVARAFADHREHRNVRECPGATAAVGAIADDYRVGLVTNGAPEMQREKLAAIGLEDAFETLVFAGYGVPSKPVPDPFDRAVTDLGVAPERTIHVGNSPESDVEGAKRAGLEAAWLDTESRDPPARQPDYVLDSMRELVEPPWE